MKTWGHTLHGSSPGWRWIEDTVETRLLRCAMCDTYSDDMILNYEPSGAHRDEIVRSVRRLGLATSSDGFLVFDDSVRAVLVRGGVPENHLRVLASDVFATDLAAIAVAPSSLPDVSRAKTCAGCGRVSPVWHTSIKDGLLVLVGRPERNVVRSAELFGGGKLRRPEVLVSNELSFALGSPPRGYDVLIATVEAEEN